jgi:DHA1 family multidrug resistance protein-like MFS transporter
MIVFSLVPYLFDAFPPAATLSALTAAAVGRILLAGALPRVVLQDFQVWQDLAGEEQVCEG